MSHSNPTFRRRPASKARAASRARGAFSLLELTLVLAIIAVLSAIAIPRYASSDTTFRVRAACDRLAQDLEFAQTLARSKSTPVAVRFSSTESRYQVVLDPGGTAQVAEDVSLDKDPYRVEIVSVSIGPGRVLTFDGYGEPDYDANIEIQERGRTRVLDFSKETSTSDIK